MFSFIFAWTNSWVNNGDAGDLRRNRSHYDVIVMGPSTQNEQEKAIAVAFVPCPTVARGVGHALMVRWDLYCANSTSIHCFRKRIAYNLHLMTSYSLWNISIRHRYRYMSLFLRQQKYITQEPVRGWPTLWLLRGQQVTQWVMTLWREVGHICFCLSLWFNQEDLWPCSMQHTLHILRESQAPPTLQERSGESISREFQTIVL